MKTGRGLAIGMGIMAAGTGLQGCWAAAAGVGAETAYVTTREDRTAGEAIDDQVIVTKIKAKMIEDPAVDALDINVDSVKGNVVLKGFVKNSESVDRAITIAQSVTGVKSVQSRLIVE